MKIEKRESEDDYDMNLRSLALNICRHVEYKCFGFICYKELVPHN